MKDGKCPMGCGEKHGNETADGGIEASGFYCFICGAGVIVKHTGEVIHHPEYKCSGFESNKELFVIFYFAMAKAAMAGESGWPAT